MRKRRKLFQVNNDVEPELSVDDILAEYNMEQDTVGADYDTGWAEHTYDEDEDVSGNYWDDHNYVLINPTTGVEL